MPSRLHDYAVNLAMLILVGSLSILSLSSAPVSAQETIRVLPGTEVSLLLGESLSSENVYKGQKFKLQVEKDVRAHGQVVIPKGTEAIGSVVSFEAHSIGGKPGELHVRINYLLLNGQRIPLFFGAGKNEKSSDGAAVVLSVLFGPLGALVKGKAALYPEQTQFLAYVDQGFEVPLKPALIAVSAPVSQPIVVDVSASPMANSDSDTSSIPQAAGKMEIISEPHSEEIKKD